MLSVVTRNNARVLWTFLRIRDFSNAASKPPRRRKSAVVDKSVPNSLSGNNGNSSAPSVSVKKRGPKAKESRASFSVAQKSFSIPTVLPDAPPQTPAKKSSRKESGLNFERSVNTHEHWSLLSLVEAEVVESHPLLKVVDLSKPFTDNEFFENVNVHRLLCSLRLCHKFEFGCQVIRARLTTLTPPAVLEASRLLADAEMKRRCAMRTQSAEELGDVTGLASDLRDQLKRIRLPPSMSVTINTLLNCVVDPSETVSRFTPEALKQPIYRDDVYHHLACAALDTEQWPMFRLIMESCPLSPHYSPILVFHIIDFAVRKPEKRKEIIEWYMNVVSQERQPLNQLQWSKYASNLIRVCGSKADPVKVTKKGELSTLTGKALVVSVPPEEHISESDFQCLKADLNNLLNELSKRSGSVTKKEVAALRQSVRSWAKTGEKAVIIDSLNVYHGTVRGFEPLVRLTNRLADEYENAILVTRPFLAEKLKSVRWHGNVRIFSCTTLSEDDLLVLLAAMEWGRNAYVLSNDRFAVHGERARCTGQLSLQDWMRRRMLRFNREDWQYDELPVYGEFVQQVGPAMYFVPVLEETPGIPERSSFLVTF